MASLILNQNGHETRHTIAKRLTTLGTEPSHDFTIQAATSGLVLTLVQESDGFDLLPGKAKVRVNGSAVSRRARLRTCDRIEWDGGVASFLASDLPIGPAGPAARDQSARAWTLLSNLAATLERPAGSQSALGQALDGLIEISGAEAGFLLCENSDRSGWDLLACREDSSGTLHPMTSSRRKLFSNSILCEALARRGLVYVENMIGHALGEAESVMAARIFSAACFPLLVGGRAIGAVFLSTHSPGRSIRRETLAELSLVATQAALILALDLEARAVRAENSRLRVAGEVSASRLVYEPRTGANAMQELDSRIGKLAPTPLSVIVRGETGSGKEVVARELHERSQRRAKPFVAVNCGAIPAPLLESTLFGHRKGAFTGATDDHPGKFVQADGGTLFLDEIGDLPLDLQVKLLRVLQDMKVEPVGATAPVGIDVRIVAATHRDLGQAVSEGRFRQDLYYRLAGATLAIPPLRERKGDIPALSRQLLARAGIVRQLSTAALARLAEHAWPGNVRELDQVVKRASYLCSGEMIEDADIDFGPAVGGAASASSDTALFWRGFEAIANLPNLKDAQLAFTREFVARTLARNGGNRTEAAAALGISERTLYRVLAGGES